MRSSLVVALFVLGCGEPTTSPVPARDTADEPSMTPVEATPPPVDPARARVIEGLERWLSGCAVTDTSFAEHKLYTWTRVDQIEALRESPRAALLSRERSGSGDLSLFDQATEDDPHPIARFLRRRGQRARRFAWVTPWATRQGWETGDYGDRLIEVTLRDDAWTARFDPAGAARWRVVDADGAEVAERDVARTPERVGAVFHVGDGPRAFREVVLVNEAQIERWAYATDALRERVMEDAARLRELAALWRDEPPELPDGLDAWLRAGWSDPRTTSLPERYQACLALASDGYAPSADRVEAIAAALEATPVDAPLERVVPRARVRRPPPASNVWCDPTMGCPP